MNIGLRFNRTRAVNLNVTSLQVVETNDKDIVLELGYLIVKDMSTRLDVSHKITQALIRKIENGFTQATDGIQTTSVRFGTDYTISRTLTLRAFFDKIINKPLVSSGSYATAHTNLGISLRFNLNQ
jgi:cell surface protein SprA